VAGAGSLIVEFATLSRLTGDDRFERAAFKSFFALWNRRSDVGLVGNNIDIISGVSLFTALSSPHHLTYKRNERSGVGWRRLGLVLVWIAFMNMP
jgi:Glycosyl hydrolase family 47